MPCVMSTSSPSLESSFSASGLLLTRGGPRYFDENKNVVADADEEDEWIREKRGQQKKQQSEQHQPQPHDTNTVVVEEWTTAGGEGG